MGTPALPQFAVAMEGLSKEDRQAAVNAVHADYAESLQSWRVLLDAFEGRGGFLTGEYLWPYPRESAESFQLRQTMARYHNYVETLVDIYVRFMWTSGVSRTVNDDAYAEWLTDVDGDGTSIDDYLKRLAGLALAGGHALALVDKTREEASGPTRADEEARVVLATFPATHVQDWRFTRSELVGVKLLEATPPVPLGQPPPDVAEQYLFWDVEGWARFDLDGTLQEGAITQLGMVPAVVLRPKPSNRSAMLGRPLISNANVVRAMFNRASEEDQVLRDQAFSVLTVSVSDGGDVDQVKKDIGTVVGTAKALITKGEIKYATPDQSVPGTIRENISFLIQEMYRAAHVRYRRDSLASESGESIRLQYVELNEMLQGFARGLSTVERRIARAWYAWQYPTVEQAQAAFEKAHPVAIYPTEFFLDSLMSDLEAWSEAIAMDLGETMTKRIKKKAARRVDPDMPPDVVETVDTEIDKLPTETQPPATDTQEVDEDDEENRGAAA